MNINSDSPLSDTGITIKSVITHFDGIRVTGLSNLENRLKYYAAGETVEITVQVIEGNSYVEKTFEITLGKASEHTDTRNQMGFGFGGFGRA